MPLRQDLKWLVFVTVLGALTTVLVAWGCVFACDPYRRPMFFNNSVDQGSWNVTRGETTGALFVHSLRVRVTGPRSIGPGGLSLPVYQPIAAQISPWHELSIAGPEYRSEASDIERHWLDARGWPMLALECEYKCDNKGNGVGVKYGALAPGAPPWKLPPHTAVRALPLKPMWFGLIVNTVLFSSGWWIVLGIPLMRKGMRTRRGLCPQCGYDLRGEFDNGCTECGWGRGQRSP